SVAAEISGRNGSCFDGDYFVEAARQWQREQADAGVEIKHELSAAIACDQLDESIGQVAIGLEKCAGADVAGIGGGVIEQAGIAEVEGRLVRGKSRLCGREYGKA